MGCFSYHPPSPSLGQTSGCVKICTGTGKFSWRERWEVGSGRVSFTFPFRFPGPDVPIGSLTFDLPTGAARPVLEEGTVSGLPLPNGHLEIRFEVGDQGRMEHIRGGDNETLDQIAKWRFRPAKLANRSISVPGTLRLYRAY